MPYTQQEEQKREKEAAKKALKKERKLLRTACKEKDFFATNEDEKVRFVDILFPSIEHMAKVHKIAGF